MQKNKLVTESTDVYGRHLNVECIFLGSIFRQFVLSRPNVNYFHYMWPICMALACVTSAVLIIQKYFEKIPHVWVVILTIICIIVSCVYSMLTDVIEESIQIIDGFGIQLNSKDRFGRESKIFFDFNSIEGVIINEAVTMQRVLFYLALMTNENKSSEERKTCNFKEGTRLITIFQHTMPRLEIIKDIYQEIQPFLTTNHNAEN